MTRYEYRITVDIPADMEPSPDAAAAHVGRAFIDMVVPPVGLIAYERQDVDDEDQS